MQGSPHSMAKELLLGKKNGAETWISRGSEAWEDLRSVLGRGHRAKACMGIYLAC